MKKSVVVGMILLAIFIAVYISQPNWWLLR